MIAFASVHCFSTHISSRPAAVCILLRCDVCRHHLHDFGGLEVHLVVVCVDFI